MSKPLENLNVARDEISASSAGGAPFLICFGATLLAAGILSFWLSPPTAALVVIFQGGVALPAAFWLETRMGAARMSPNNPLRSLSVQLAMSQMPAMVAAIVAYAIRPDTVPVVMAAIAGGHFFPYAWLQRTRVYIAMGAAVALGAFALQIVLRSHAFPWVLFYMTACYWIAAPLVYRNAKRLVKAGPDLS